jgi:lysophospholipase L1-like esterase
MKSLRLLIAILGWLFVGAVASAPAAEASVRLAVIGDSTVCDYPAEKPERGWGQYLQGYFDASVKVTNLAKSGRSTKTFIKEGLWQKTLDGKPTHVLIQFGHNDSHAPERPESTNAATDYQDFLRRYVEEARAIGAKPILVTPMVRRLFGNDGKLRNELQPYADAMKQVARERHVPLIDLHAASKALVEPLGVAGSAYMANKPGDHTHFGERGAQAMAQLVMRALPEAAPELKARLKQP